ncbi:Phage protein Gp37/Gp68 [compost metagenome]
MEIFSSLKIKHKNIICQPLLENLNIKNYLDKIELVIVGGESDKNARVLDYNWVTNIQNQCKSRKINFEFRQCGTNFVKDGKMYILKTNELCAQAKKANINLKY